MSLALRSYQLIWSSSTRSHVGSSAVRGRTAPTGRVQPGVSLGHVICHCFQSPPECLEAGGSRSWLDLGPQVSHRNGSERVSKTSTRRTHHLHTTPNHVSHCGVKSSVSHGVKSFDRDDMLVWHKGGEVLRPVKEPGLGPPGLSGRSEGLHSTKTGCSGRCKWKI